MQYNQQQQENPVHAREQAEERGNQSEAEGGEPSDGEDEEHPLQRRRSLGSRDGSHIIQYGAIHGASRDGVAVVGGAAAPVGYHPMWGRGSDRAANIPGGEQHQPLLPQRVIGHQHMDYLAVIRRKCFSVCSWKVHCSVGVSLLLLAAVLLSLSIVMFTSEREDVVYIYTTANESNSVYTRGEVWLMRSVCMITDPSDSEGLNWVLHTGSCDHGQLTNWRHIIINDHTTSIKGYFFYFVVGSYVTTQPQSVKAQFVMETDAKKASEMDGYCGSEKGPMPPSFDTTGYYYICIIPSAGRNLTFEIDVHEHYYDRNITNQCNNTRFHGSVMHKCCDFGFSETFANLKCVYLTTRNQMANTNRLTSHQVRVYLEYNDTVKTLTVVTVLAMILASSLLLVSAGRRAYRAYRARQAQRAPPQAPRAPLRAQGVPLRAQVVPLRAQAQL